MRAYYNSDTGYVISVSDSLDVQCDFVEVSNIEEYLQTVNSGLVPKVESGQIVFVKDSAEAWRMIREARDTLLIEGDHAINMVYDESRISGTDVNPEKLRLIAEYRQALRDITNSTDPENVIWPQKSW
jgi:nitrate reductase NapAB chaperone NapD